MPWRSSARTRRRCWHRRRERYPLPNPSPTERERGEGRSAMSTVAPERVSGQIALPASARTDAASAARRRAWRRNLMGYLFIAPWLIGFLAFTAIPMLGSAFLAFTDYNVLSQ